MKEGWEYKKLGGVCVLCYFRSINLTGPRSP